MLYSVDQGSGVATAVGPLGFPTETLTASADGARLLTVRIQGGVFEVLEIDPQTGATQLVHSIPTILDRVDGVAAVGGSRLVCMGGCSAGSGCGSLYGLFAVDLSAATVSGVTRVFYGGNGVAYDGYYDNVILIAADGQSLRRFRASDFAPAGGGPPLGLNVGIGYTVEVQSRQRFFIAGDGLYEYATGFGVATMIGLPFPGGLRFSAIALVCGERTTVTSRVGVPANPAAFQRAQTTMPNLGATWDPFVDHSTFVPGSLADAGIVSFAPTNLATPFGTLLCQSVGAITLSVSRPGQPFLLPIPLDCGLSGLQVHIQAVSLDQGGVAHLTNALDAVLGTY